MAVSAIRVSSKSASAANLPVLAKGAPQKPAKTIPSHIAREAIEQLTESFSQKLALSKVSVSRTSQLLQAAKTNDFEAMKRALFAAKEAGENIELLASQVVTQAALKATLDQQARKGIDSLKSAFLHLQVQAAFLQKRGQLLEAPLAKEYKIADMSKKAIVDALLELKSPEARRVASQIEAISAISHEHHKLTALQMLAICLYCDDELTRVAQMSETIYLRAQDTNLARTVVIDPKRLSYTILSKKHGSLQAQGAFKRVTEALEVMPLEKKVQVNRAVRLVSKAFEEITERELGFEELYGDIFSWMNYTAKNRSGETKTQILEEAYDHDMYIFTEYTAEKLRKKLPLDELVDILSDVGQTLSKMHKDNVVHHDFKTKNVLYRKNQSGMAEAKVIDFGHCYRPKDLHVYQRKRNKGYGTLRYTAVDVLENPRLKDDIRLLAKAEDMYALGIFIYELHFQKITPWGHSTYKALKSTSTSKEKNRKKAIRLQKEAARSLAEEAKKGPKTGEREIVRIASRLLEPDPYDRMKIDEFMTAIKDLKASIDHQ